MSDKVVHVREDGAWELDAASYLPKPEGYVKVDGVEYPVYSFMDVPSGDSLKVMKLADDIDSAKGLEEQRARSIDQIMILNSPAAADRRIPREKLESLTPRQIVALVFYVNSVAAVPLAAGGAPIGESPSPGLASAVSTDGAPAS